MSSPQHYRQLSLPTGTETLQLQEAARHRRVTRALEDLFSRWGYDPAETAMVDYFDVYRRLLRDEDVKQMYRAVDRQGEILALRADTTLFLAKQLGLHLTAADLPVRVSYSDQIVRAEDRHDISNNEYQQAGIELVGVAGTDGDAEVLMLAAEALDALGLDDAVLHVGSHAVVTACAEAAGMSGDLLANAVRRRAFDGDDLVAVRSAGLADFLAFIGSPNAFRDAVATGTPPSVSSAASHLLSVLDTVMEILPDPWRDRIRVDLSELGAYHYYTGVAFGAYIPSSNAAVLRGGRYDRLLQAFGFDAPSVGFSLFTRKLPPTVLADHHDAAPPEHATGDDLTARVASARSLQAQGKRVYLS